MAALRNLRHERFCLEYLKDGNAAQALARAGFADATPHKHAWRLLRRADVAGRVAELREAKLRALHLSVDEILAGIARVARFDHRRLFDAQGLPIPMHLLDEDTAGAIASFVVDEKLATTRRAAGGGDEAAEAERVTLSVRTSKVRAADRLRALEMLARHRNLYREESRTAGAAAGEALAQLLLRAQAAESGVAGLMGRGAD